MKGEITRVQAQVGEVSNQVNTVKSDLRRCKDKWEASADAMSGRILKLEQDFQTFILNVVYPTIPPESVKSRRNYPNTKRNGNHQGH